MVSQYLTDDEIPEYCDLLPVTHQQVIFASGIIDAFVGLRNGKSKFQLQEATEKHLRPNRRGVINLKYSPVVSIEEISLCIPNSFAYTATVPICPEDVQFDESGYIYLPMHHRLPVTSNNLYGRSPVGINISYLYGYEEIPQNVKLACAMIAMNISQQGGFANIQSATNLDARYSLTDPSVFTDDIRRMLVAYR